MTARTFSAAQATGEPVEANVLMCPVSFSARYDLDRVTGVISRENHPLKGMSVKDKIFVAPEVQGGVAAAWAFLAMKGQGVGFAGLVFGRVNPVMVQGAVTAGVPIFAGVEESIFETLKTGDRVRLDPAARTITALGSGEAT